MLLDQQTCRKGALSMAPREGSCLTFRKELSKETLADKARDFIGKGHPGREQQGREPRRTALPHGSQSPVLC